MPVANKKECAIIAQMADQAFTVAIENREPFVASLATFDERTAIWVIVGTTREALMQAIATLASGFNVDMPVILESSDLFLSRPIS